MMSTCQWCAPPGRSAQPMNWTPRRATSWTTYCFRAGQRANPELYSGKHKTTGTNVQVACTIIGCPAWISDPIPGSRHDNRCHGGSAVLPSVDPCNWLGDNRYVGNNMITPFRKPEGVNSLIGRGLQ